MRNAEGKRQRYQSKRGWSFCFEVAILLINPTMKWRNDITL